MILNFLDLLFTVLWLAIFGRVVMSWISPQGNDALSTLLYQITEPIMQPIRKVMPSTGMFDLTPMVTIFLLILVQRVIYSVLK